MFFSHERFTMQMNPYLSFKGDCEAAFRFYEQSLGAEVGAIFRYGGSPMAGDVPSDWSSIASGFRGSSTARTEMVDQPKFPTCV